jgi:hypothetical protein
MTAISMHNLFLYIELDEIPGIFWSHRWEFLVLPWASVKRTDNYITNNIASFSFLTFSRWCRCCVVECYAVLTGKLFLKLPTFRRKLMIFRTKQSKMILVLPYKITSLYESEDKTSNLSVYESCLS